MMTDKFEVPNELPEGPWIVDGLYVRTVETTYDDNIVAKATSAPIARAIAAIPAMVEEIGRPNQENGMLKARSHRIGVDVTEAFSDNQRLIALNAELRHTLKPFAEAADAAERNLCKHSTDEILIRLGRLREARAIFAKQETSSNAEG